MTNDEVLTAPMASAAASSELVSDAYGTDPGPSTSVRRYVSRAAVIRAKCPAWAKVMGATLALPLALYVVLRPENYGLTPNNLDPIFYSGYSINFDDALNAAGAGHYFISRWSVYLPMYVANIFFGPFLGRLLWRLALAAVILWSLWAVGKSRRLRWDQQLVIGVLTLTMPMFVRAFFTDYMEYLIVGLGICMVCLCLREVQRAWSVGLIGVLAGLIVVANPIAVTAVGFPLAACVLLGARRVRLKILIAAGIAVAALSVFMAGLVLFRWRYGVSNVYKPTFDFIRNYEGQDGFKSPRLDWLTHFTWLFATPFLLLVAAGAAWRSHVKFPRGELTALILCGLQYVYQWLDQFIRNGDGLEVSYYWSFSFPTFAVALAVVVGHVTDRMSRRLVLAFVALWIVFLLAGVPDFARLPSGFPFFAIAIAIALGATALFRRSPAGAGVVVVFFIGWTQIGAPHYDPSAYFALNTSPRYDQLFRQAGNQSETVYDEAVWFAEKMDTIPNDASTSFVAAGGFAISIVGLYEAHVDGRIVGTDDDRAHLTSIAISEIRSGTRPIVAVYGPPDDVAEMISTFPKALGVGRQVLDVTHHGGFGYRLVVYSMPDNTRLPFTWTADSLPIATGIVKGSAVSVGPGFSAGFVTFGPYVPLHAGTYTVTISYESSAGTDAEVGSFDVSSPEDSPASSIALAGTGGRASTAAITFTVLKDGSRWEFRSRWTGIGDLQVNGFTLSSP